MKRYLILAFLSIAIFASARLSSQLRPRFQMSELRPGMMVRELPLHVHSKVDTLLWGGSDGASILSFKGEYLKDTGEYRLATKGPEITQVSFISKPRTVEQNHKVWGKLLEKLRSMHGKPSEEYHNVYEIMTWDGVGEQLRASTTDSGKFYSVALSQPVVATRPSIPSH